MLLRVCVLAFAVAVVCACSTAPVAGAGSRRARASSLFPTAPPNLSPDCRSKRMAGELFRRPLRALSRAVRAKRTVKVLAIGSSSTVGVGASSPRATYIAQARDVAGRPLKGMDFDVVGRGMSGEVAQGAADRMKREVEETKPDLVVWQVGTNDALRHVSIDSFKNCLRTTLAWLAENRIDVVLIDPQYGEALAKDAYYEQVVAAVAEVAREVARAAGRPLRGHARAAARARRPLLSHLRQSAPERHRPPLHGRAAGALHRRRPAAADAEASQPVFYP